MNHSTTIDKSGVVRGADGTARGRVTFVAEKHPRKRERQIAALRAMIKTDRDDFSRAMHQAALDRLLAENRGEM